MDISGLVGRILHPSRGSDRLLRNVMYKEWVEGRV